MVGSRDTLQHILPEVYKTGGCPHLTNTNSLYIYLYLFINDKMLILVSGMVTEMDQNKTILIDYKNNHSWVQITATINIMFLLIMRILKVNNKYHN